MSIGRLQAAAILLDPRVSGPALHALRETRRRGIRRLPDSVYDLRSGRVRPHAALDFVREWLAGERLTRHRGQWVLNSFLPPFPGTAYRRLFENLFSGRHLSPVSAFLAVTGRCPAHCAHCSRGGRREGRELTTEQWSDTIAQLHGLGVSIVGFTGGEPCVREDLDSLVRAAAQDGAATILFTSGIGLNEPLLRRLKTAGLWSVCVSIDGDTAALHDAGRGTGAFGIATAALRAVRRHGFYTMAGSVATADSVDKGLHVRIHRMLAELGVHEFRIVEAMPCGRLTDCAGDLLLSPAHVAELRRFHVETNRQRRGPKVCAFNQIESPGIFGCGAGTQHLFIEPSGVVCPCDFTPLGFGNVCETPLADIWRRMNLAMGDNPRTHCFIQRNRSLVREKSSLGYPLPPEASEAVCRAAGPEPLPGYFALVAQGGDARGAPRQPGATP